MLLFSLKNYGNVFLVGTNLYKAGSLGNKTLLVLCLHTKHAALRNFLRNMRL